MNEWGNSESLKYSMSPQFLKLTQKKEQNQVICRDIDKPRGCHTK